MELQVIQQRIYTIRNQRVMLDFDLAELYEVENRALKQAVKRNLDRFPEDFMYQLTKEEWTEVITFCDNLPETVKFSPALPFAFTEQGVAMLSSVLKSKKALQVNIAIMRTFVLIRQYALSYKDLADKIELILAQQDGYDVHLSHIYAAIEGLLGDKEEQKALEEAWKNRNPIGFRKGE